MKLIVALFLVSQVAEAGVLDHSSIAHQIFQDDLTSINSDQNIDQSRIDENAIKVRSSRGMKIKNLVAAGGKCKDARYCR